MIAIKNCFEHVNIVPYFTLGFMFTEKSKGRVTIRFTPSVVMKITSTQANAVPHEARLT